LLRRHNVSGRYEVHELLRQYAEEKLKAAADSTAIYNSHSQYYLGLLVQSTPKLKGHGQLDALNAIDTDFENSRAAWRWAVDQCDTDGIRRAMEGLYLFLTFRNRFMDGEQLFGAARQVWKADGATPPLLAGQVLVRFPEEPPLDRYRKGL